MSTAPGSLLRAETYHTDRVYVTTVAVVGHHLDVVTTKSLGPFEGVVHTDDIGDVARLLGKEDWLILEVTN